MCQNRCQQNCMPRVQNCGQDPRVAAARAQAIAQAGIQTGRCQDVFDCQTQVIVEPAVVSAPNIINHHRRVEHIVPVITENIHRNHTTHEFVVRPEPVVRQTFDANFTAGRPLPAQPFVGAQSFNQMPLQPQQQMVPVEVDVIEKFGFANQNVNVGGFNNQIQTMPMNNGFANQTFTQVPMGNVGMQPFNQMPLQGFVR